MRQLAWALGALFLAGIIHLVAVLVLPIFATGDAWNRLARYGDFNRMHILPAATPLGQAITNMDPALEYAICRFDLAEGPLRIDAVVPLGYWSIAIYDRHAGNYYALNDRSADMQTVTLWIADQDQILSLIPEGQEDTGTENQDVLLIKSPERFGLAILRVMVPEESFRGRALEALENSSCQIDISILGMPDAEDEIPVPGLLPTSTEN